MSNELILITGATETGKTWLANCILAKYPDTGIWDEPDLYNVKVRKEIKAQLKIGRAILTMEQPPGFPVPNFPPIDRTIMLFTNV